MHTSTILNASLRLRVDKAGIPFYSDIVHPCTTQGSVPTEHNQGCHILTCTGGTGCLPCRKHLRCVQRVVWYWYCRWRLYQHTNTSSFSPLWLSSSSFKGTLVEFPFGAIPAEKAQRWDGNLPDANQQPRFGRRIISCFNIMFCLYGQKKEFGINVIKCVPTSLLIHRPETSARYSFLPRWDGDIGQSKWLEHITKVKVCRKYNFLCYYHLIYLF